MLKYKQSPFYELISTDEVQNLANRKQNKIKNGNISNKWLVEDISALGSTLTESSLPPLETGFRLGGYEIEKRVACSLPVEMYAAKHTATHIAVILKILRAPDDIQPNILATWREDFGVELDILKDLDGHPNIIRLLDQGEKEHLTYAAIEKTNGGSLKQCLENHSVCLSERLVWITDILDAYAWMHLRQVLHGDVHLRNILLTEHKKVKVAGFDVASRLKSTQNHSLVDIHEFTAPEKIDKYVLGKAKFAPDFRSEVYQLGLLCYYILYEKMPFVEGAWKRRAKSRKEDIVGNTTANGEFLPDELREWLKMALENDPQMRYDSARSMYFEFADALDVKVTI